MNILIIGAAGMLGRKLALALIAKGAVVRGRAVERLTLADISLPEAPSFAGTVETIGHRPLRTAARLTGSSKRGQA